jgi:hypothetical protein
MQANTDDEPKLALVEGESEITSLILARTEFFLTYS